MRETGREKSKRIKMDGSSKEGVLPYDVLINILKRVSVKSLIRFKSVSKHWAKFLESPHFISQHLLQSSQNNTFLLLHRIPHRSPPLTSSACLIGPNFEIHDPHFINFTSHAHKIIGCSNGLLCVKQTTDAAMKLSLFNPATKQIKQVPQTLCDSKNFYYIGFGFTPLVNDYKIVTISFCEFDDEDQVVVLDDIRVDRVDVYSLSKDSWTQIDSTVLRNLCLVSTSVTVNGAIFWQATTTSDPDEPEFVISFDVAREEFRQLKAPLPPPSSIDSYCNVLAVCNHKLAMFRHFIVGNFESCSIDLWVLEDSHDAGESWTKMYNVGPFSRMLYPLHIWKDEIVCREELTRRSNERMRVETVLSLLNPYSKELKKLPAHREKYCYASFDYAESLVPVAANMPHQQ